MLTKLGMSWRTAWRGVISPRFDVQLEDVEKGPNNLLLSQQFGFIIMATAASIMGHKGTRSKYKGGKNTYMKIKCFHGDKKAGSDSGRPDKLPVIADCWLMTSF